MSHTGIPWEIVDNPVQGNMTVVAHPTGGSPTHMIVAALPPHNPATPSNARLIAAAPELLAELENAVIAMQCQCDEAYTRRDRHEPNSFCYLLPDFETVIKKAKGETE